MERPNPNQRWDKPCFRLTLEEPTPFEEIATVLLNQANKPREPVSTKPEAVFGENFVFELDRACQSVANFIQQSGQTIGDTLKGFPDCKRSYKVVKSLSPLELKRLKKDFLTLSKLHPPPQNAMGDTFLEFL